MVLGLLGNALGLDRTSPSDMRRLDSLQASTWFSALLLSEPGCWTDVQNNRTPSSRLKAAHEKPQDTPQPGDTAARFDAGGRISDHPLAYGIGAREGVERIRDLLHKAPRQRTKHYLTGLRALAAFSPIGDRWPEPPDRLASALRHPARALWIGRKSCPPSAPVCLRQSLVDATNGPEALLRAIDAEEDIQAGDITDASAVLWWDGEPEPGGPLAASLGISGGFATTVADRRDWVRGLHNATSTMHRGAIRIPDRRSGRSNA